MASGCRAKELLKEIVPNPMPVVYITWVLGTAYMSERSSLV